MGVGCWAGVHSGQGGRASERIRPGGGAEWSTVSMWTEEKSKDLEGKQGLQVGDDGGTGTHGRRQY